jgi:hypothetical protein
MGTPGALSASRLWITRDVTHRCAENDAFVGDFCNRVASGRSKAESTALQQNSTQSALISA